ncbi:MAR-binding filament-like protein 1 [Hibiscus syriacus]|uniref:MAR-binding filament-like protein 1 n=1 Tax=Hibiscus syriacus TaxID=106335 RepID=UPI0019220AE9|nr:MAR-binding filament-like protein 1 [Hibiscus syriacus]
MENNIQKLSSSLAEKESELKKLEITHKKTMEELGKASSKIDGLREELQRNQSELQSKNSVVDELNARIGSLTVDAELLREREKEIHYLKEKLEVALNDASENKAIVADLIKEKVNLKKALEAELQNVKNLK